MGAARLLSEHFRVITVDARNHGASFHAASHTFDDMVDDLMEFMDHLGLDTATLMGHSMGGKEPRGSSIQGSRRAVEFGQ